MTGVINFITDRKFNGIKGHVGLTIDAPNPLIKAYAERGSHPRESTIVAVESLQLLHRHHIRVLIGDDPHDPVQPVAAPVADVVRHHPHRPTVGPVMPGRVPVSRPGPLGTPDAWAH